MLHQVGVGALGPVFRTYEPTRDRLVAVKVFRLDITPEQAQALADELATAAGAGLFHPSIVEPIAAGVEGTVAYRADEYVAAETLDVALRHYAPAPIEKALPLITQLAAAIDFARAAGVGHGALHPRDIFVTPEEVRASGFGVVEALERVGLRAPVRRPYTAPERVAGTGWGAPADVFSLAAISFELLTSRRPSGTGPQIGAVPDGPHASAIHAVLERAMHDDPAQRYPSALAFATALEAAARGDVVAPGIAPVPMGEVDDFATEMEPAAGVSARAEPAEADQEEAAFRAEEPALDDIEAEREADHALVAAAAEEQDVAGAGAEDDPSLFDDEAVEDLALEAEARADASRFADEFATAEIRSRTDTVGPDEFEDRQAPGQDEEEEVDRRPATAAARTAYDVEPVVLYERSGLGLVSSAIVVVLALIVGFAGGYAVRDRAATRASGESQASAAGEGSATASRPAPAAKPYSEQAVEPPPSQATSGRSEPPKTATATPSAATPPVSTPPGPVDSSAPRTTTPAMTSGTIAVKSTPPGAGVVIDDKWRGRTPLTVSKIPFGRHTVRIVQPGYATESEAVTLSAAAPQREVSARLQRTVAKAPPASATPSPAPGDLPPVGRRGTLTGSIYVDSRPRGARVLVDGKFVGTTPLRIPDLGLGPHTVLLQLPDHSDWTSTTRVTAGQEARVTGSLERIR